MAIIRLASLAVCLALAGCSGAPPPPRMLTKAVKIDCDGNRPCVINVLVTCPGDPQQNCATAVDYDLVLLRNKQGNDKITWLLPQGSDFTFADKTGVAVE